MIISQADISKIYLGENAFLRPLSADDVTAGYVEGLNDPEVYRFLVGPSRQRQTIELVRGFVRANEEDLHAILFGLFVDGSLRGTSRLHDICLESAYLGIALFDRSIWGQGWGTRMIRGIVDYAVDSLDVKKVFAGIENENMASQCAFEKAGFQRCDDHLSSDKSQLWVSSGV